MYNKSSENVHLLLIYLCTLSRRCIIFRYYGVYRDDETPLFLSLRVQGHFKGLFGEGPEIIFNILFTDEFLLCVPTTLKSSRTLYQ